MRVRKYGGELLFSPRPGKRSGLYPKGETQGFRLKAEQHPQHSLLRKTRTQERNSNSHFPSAESVSSVDKGKNWLMVQ